MVLLKERYLNSLIQAAKMFQALNMVNVLELDGKKLK